MRKENSIRPESEGHVPPRGFIEASTDARLQELETENQRLQLLVAELLLKNQQLRKPQLTS